VGEVGRDSPIAEPPAPEPPPPSPFARLSPRPAHVAGAAFDVLTQASRDLRRASFYVGLVVLLLGTPFALLLWRLSLEPLPETPYEELGIWTSVGTATSVTGIIALGAVVLATIESRAVAVILLASRLAARGSDVRAAVQRSRTVFWRLLAALAITNVPLFLVQSFLEDRMAAFLGGVSEPSVVSAAILAAVIFAPLAYVVTGVVLGDVGPWTAVRRSFGLFRAAKATGVVVALFEFGAQLLVAFGLLAGVDLVLRAVEATGFSADHAAGAALAIVLIVALVFATGSLLFTVAAVAIAPQVVAFVALTHAAPGLERIGGEDGRFRWLTRPLIAAAAVGAIALAGGLAALG
jgi:hypothetical protein